MTAFVVEKSDEGYSEQWAMTIDDVSFTDRDLQHRVGRIVRVNQCTATLDCDSQKWRVAFELLRPPVNV